MIENLAARHAEILNWMVENDAHVEAGTGSDVPNIVHFSTLQAMARRGLVELSWKRQDALYGSTKPYRIAKITEAGRQAVAKPQADITPAEILAAHLGEEMVAIEIVDEPRTSGRPDALAMVRAQLHAVAVEEADAERDEIDNEIATCDEGHPVYYDFKTNTTGCRVNHVEVQECRCNEDDVECGVHGSNDEQLPFGTTAQTSAMFYVDQDLYS
jgi:hypothetical protein